MKAGLTSTQCVTLRRDDTWFVETFYKLFEPAGHALTIFDVLGGLRQ